MFDAQEEIVIFNFLLAHGELVDHIDGFFARVLFVFAGAVKHTRAAAGAVFHCYLHGEFFTGQVGFAVGGFESFGSVFSSASS